MSKTLKKHFIEDPSPIFYFKGYKGPTSYQVTLSEQENSCYLPSRRRYALQRLIKKLDIIEGVDFSYWFLRDINLEIETFISCNFREARFSNVNLSQTSFEDCNFRDAQIRQTCHFDGTDFGNQIILGPTRSDGYLFFLTRTEPGSPRVKAGCRNFTLRDAYRFWKRTRGGTPLGDETLAILDALKALAKTRNWSV